MQRIIIWLSLLLITAGCNSQAAAGEQPPQEPIPQDLAYNFTLETLSGNTITLEDLRGKWVLINFWATWCAPCVEEMPYFEQIANERDIVVLGINFSEMPEDVTKFVEEHNVTFPILMNPDEVILTVYQARSLPRTLVVSPDGTVVHRIIGPVMPEQFDPWLDEHLAQTNE